MNRSYVIGIDVGGTRIKAGAVTVDGKALADVVLPTHPEHGPRKLLATLVEAIRAIQAKLKLPAYGVGLGMSGAVDPAKGVVLLPGKFKGLENFPIVPQLARMTKLPVVADNDARAAMVGEQRFGAARGRKWVVLITIGTGLGSCAILDGKILRDPHLQFGTQLGFTIMQPLGGRLCLSGARGTAEMLCSATALASAVCDGLRRGIPSTLSDRFWKDAHSIDFAAVMQAADRGDRLCRDELNHWTTNLGWLLVSAVHVYAPELIILGGGGANAARQFLPALRRHVNQHVFRHPRGQRLPIVASRLGDRAGVLGAAALAWEQMR